MTIAQSHVRAPLVLLVAVLAFAPAAAARERDGDGLTVRASETAVDLSDPVSFSGRRSPERADRVVMLKYRAAGERRAEQVGQVRTDARGRYELTVKPRRNGVFRAISERDGDGRTLRSERIDVGVHARVKIEAKKHQLRDRGVRIAGRAAPRGSGRKVVVQRLAGKGWARVGTDRTDSRGRYAIRWSSAELGSHRFRVRARGDEQNLRGANQLEHRVRVYREDGASYYGPGLYGNTTACGQTLRTGTVGVAHKSLPCGTKVRFHYRGRTKRIEVIDRGPYIHDRRWDLTEAARERLGFPRGVDQIWANR